jgi:CRISPR type IV-associated DEAD/DEAH-box helicase Csf4
MDYLWRAIATSSILVSGTLYEEHPRINCETARRSLSVAIDYVVEMEPVHARWQYAPVTACVVSPTYSPDGRAQFVRPKPDKNGREEAGFQRAFASWVGDVATYLQKAHSTAAGGTLVLGTAFHDIEAIAQSLNYKDPAMVTFIQRSGVRLAGIKDQYLDSIRSGHRPILFAVGGAWTGFDLHDPAYPDALTDLAILNAPFGAISKSLARQSRARAHGGIFEVIGQMVILVRQGAGRLVRSPDTPKNRRIHWLDARIHDVAQQGIYSPVKRFLAKYTVLPV